MLLSNFFLFQCRLSLAYEDNIGYLLQDEGEEGSYEYHLTFRGMQASQKSGSVILIPWINSKWFK